jgi:hypothetical protein
MERSLYGRVATYPYLARIREGGLDHCSPYPGVRMRFVVGRVTLFPIQYQFLTPRTLIPFPLPHSTFEKLVL